jgi:anti-sigma factor RsiW
MTEQHVPIEELAAYAAGDLDATAAVAVEAHLLLCPRCAADVEGLTATAAALAAVPPVAMPAAAAAALDAALLAEAFPNRRAGDVVPIARRRRPTSGAIAAVAAGVALIAAIGVPLVAGGAKRSSTLGAAGRARDTASAPKTVKRLASGLDYTRATLAATLVQAVNGATRTTAFTGGVAGPGSAKGSATPAAPAAAPGSGEELDATMALADDAARLAACVTELAQGQSAAAAVPLLVDFATFAGKPAVVVAFPNVSRGGTVSTKIDVFVAGAGCGAVPGGDVLDFQRIDRPAGL